VTVVALVGLMGTGKTVRQLWKGGGEAAYRRLESETVLQTLAGRPDAVLAAPGGVVLDPDVRAALAQAFVVWLRADPATLSGRVQRDDHRPLLGEHPQQVLTTLERERAGLYEGVADLVVDTDHQDPATVAGQIVQALRDQAPDA
jgi:shikimate kinase